jgi:hypothetical protein
MTVLLNNHNYVPMTLLHYHLSIIYGNLTGSRQLRRASTLANY